MGAAVPESQSLSYELDSEGFKLVAGRARRGGDRVSHAATRNMACCAVQGQGAGVAAAWSVKNGAGFAEVDLPALQELIKAQGVRIH